VLARFPLRLAPHLASRLAPAAFTVAAAGPLLLRPAAGWAQDAPALGAAARAGAGALTGRVLDARGRPVAHAQVAVLGPDGAAGGGPPVGAAVDAEGRFAVAELAPGRYRVRVTALGYVPEERADVAPGAAPLAVTLADQGATLAGVRVVGQKRRTSTVTKAPVPLADLPMSVQIVGTELMQEQQAIDLRDVVRNVSGVTPTGTYNGGYVFYNSRGFSMNNGSNFRRNGMMVWNMGHHFADNIEQVEVLKGPASIQYGDVAPGGIMNFVTKQPEAAAHRRLETKFGQYGLVRPTLDVNQPLNASGTLLSRVNATYERSNSFRDRVSSAAVMLAPTLAWKPSARLAWTVEGTYKRDRRVGDPGLISPDGTFAGLSRVPVTRFLGEPGARYEFADVGLYSTLAYAVRPAWRVQQVTYYTDTRRAPNNIYLEATAPDAAGLVPRSQYSFRQWFRGGGGSVDLIGEGATGPFRHRVVVGADYLFTASRFTNGIDAPLDRAISLEAPRYGEATLGEAPVDWDRSRFYYDRRGLYAQDQIGMLDDRVQLLLGARYNVTSTGNKYDTPADAPDGYRVPVDRLVSPRVGLVVKPRRWLSLYGSYAESYEMNGPDWIDPRIVIGPTEADQLEAGAKASLLGDRLGVTLSAFRIGKQGIYGWVDAPTRPTIPVVAWDSAGAWATYLGGTHRSQGLELDVNGRVAGALTVNATASLIDGRVVRDPAYRSGNRLGGTAREIANLWLNYTVPARALPASGPIARLAGLELGWGAFYRGRFYQTTANDPENLVGAFRSMDVALGYRFGGVRARLNVANVTNAVGYTSSFGVYEPLWVRRALLSLSTTF
jgi:iron complex outermembrane receptor protein